MSIDLHIHTSASDGNIHPEKVLLMAAENGLRTIAFADHETTVGFEMVKSLAEQKGIEIIPAVELQTWYNEQEVHILGYFVDPSNTAFQSQLAELRDERNRCALRMVEKINSFGLLVEWEQVRGLSKLGGPISKGHIVQILRENGYIKNREDAIRIMGSYLNQEGKAYCRYNFTVSEAITLIKSAGGVPVLAHPGLIGDDAKVEGIIDLGIAGLEVYYYYFGSSRESLIKKYEKMAFDKGLIMTGGSDFHGTITPVILGELHVPDKVRKNLGQPLSEL